MIQRWEVILVSQRQKKQVRIERKFMHKSASNGSLLEKLMAMKIELRQYTLTIIVAVDTVLSSAERVYFPDGVVN